MYRIKKAGIIAALTLFLGLLVFYPRMENVFWVRYAFLSILAVISFLLCGGAVKTRRESLFMLIFVLFAGLSAFYSRFRFDAYYEWVQLLMFVLTPALLLQLVPRAKREAALIITIELIAVYSIMQYFGVNFILDTHRLAGNRIIGTIGNPNFLAGVLGPVFVYVLFQSLYKKRYTYALFSIPILAALLYTKTRGAIIGVAAALVIFIFFEKKYRIIGLAALLIFAAVLSLNVSRFSGMLSKTRSLSGNEGERLVMWMVTLDMVRAHPFLGIGYGNFKNEFTTYQGDVIRSKRFNMQKTHARHGHSLYLETWATLGTIGFAIFLVFVLSIFKLARRRDKMPVFLALSALFTHSLVSVALYYPSVMLVFAFLLAVVYELPHEKQIDEHPPPSFKLNHWEIGLILLFIAAGAVTFVKEYLAQVDVTRANVLRRTDKRGLAPIYYKNAVRLAPQYVQAEYALGNYCAKKQKFYEAVSYYKKGLRANPAYEEFYYNAALAYSDAGKYYYAVDNYKKAAELYPLFFRAHFNLALLYRDKLKKYNSAAAVFRFLNYVQPNNSEVLINGGYTYELLKDLPRAKYFYKKAIDLDPKNKKAIANMYYVVNQQKKQSAEAAAAGAGQKAAVARMSAALDAAVKKSDWREAAKIAKDILRADPRNEKAYLYLGNIASVRKDYDEALKYYKKLVQINPLYASAYSNIGYIYYMRNDFENAEYFFKKAVEINPQFKSGYNNLIVLYQRWGKPKKAEEMRQMQQKARK